VFIENMTFHRCSGREESMTGLAVPFAFKSMASDLVPEPSLFPRETLRAAGEVTTEGFPIPSSVCMHVHFTRIIAFEPPVTARL